LLPATFAATMTTTTTTTTEGRKEIKAGIGKRDIGGTAVVSRVTPHV